ncbi:MAG TPA: metallophosphoesterase, partial [Planctomycetota bacterium]|nr:metallophosphoesterase [Planctomycetota bacterium]
MTALLLLVLLQAAPPAEKPAAPARCGAVDTCTKGARPGELSLVFLGDSGFGEGGSSEWGPHSQAAVASRLAALCPRPDLVLFLGDNVYWRGSPDLFAPRFDTMYAPLFDLEQRRVHAALGNHDVKGCQLSRRTAYRAEETCGDALARLVVEDVKRDLAPGSPLVSTAVMDKARTVSRADCPPAFDQAYEQGADSGTACYATEALLHQPFGYGQRGGNPLRYYSIDAPLAAPAAGAAAPHARVLVTDSNTLRRGPGPAPGLPTERVLKPGGDSEDAPVLSPDRWDALQALWVEN